MKKNFKDFWTHDTKRFYDDSWGHEDFNHERALSSMPGDPAKWKICADDYNYKKNIRRSGPICLNCKEHGHVQYECFKRQSLKCAICGSKGHLYYRCPKAICTTCRSNAQSHTTSCFNCHRVKFLQCGLCKDVGHEMKHCPDLWRRYHQTTKHCNKKLKRSIEPLKKESKMWCPNCAKKGHPADKCKYPRQDRTLTTSQVISYENTYNKDFNLEQSCVESAVNAPKIMKGEKTDKYRKILEKLKKKCKKSDSESLELIKCYLNDIKNKKYSRALRRNINKLRNKIKNS